ncbi:hypothetical protein [Cryptosporangium phraense]|uniref:Uncharacterized protein n=1 Tax=Cryptosporangium phraense TaxID=2593070 RepID=A0A545AUR1_9ACTN|nr:hypothetical protein [Cryptosporangium phraense]TQS44325.1 hypothetical protein FL583_15445 [Cryptosporangium phraense]
MISDTPDSRELVTVRVISGEPCPSKSCPKVIDPEDGSGDLIVQGAITDVETDEGETTSRISAAYLADAVDALRAAGRL